MARYGSGTLRMRLALALTLAILGPGSASHSLSAAAIRVGPRPAMGDCMTEPWPCAWNTGLATVQATPVRRGGVVTLYAYPASKAVTVSWEGVSARIPGTPLPGSCTPGAVVCKFRLGDEYDAVRWSPAKKEWVGVSSPGWVAAGGVACAAIGCASMWTWVPVVDGYAIAGTVRDANGGPLPRVNIVVTGNGRRVSVATDDSGYYVAEVPARVNYTVKAPAGFCAKGASPCTRSRVVKPNVANVDFRRRRQTADLPHG